MYLMMDIEINCKGLCELHICVSTQKDSPQKESLRVFCCNALVKFCPVN